MPKKKTFTEVLRAEVEKKIKKGATPYRVAKDAEVDPIIIYRFLSEERGLNLKTVDKLCESLGLKLIKK